MEGEERHAVGSAPGALLLPSEPKAAEAPASRRGLFESSSKAANSFTTTTTAISSTADADNQAASLPSTSHLAVPSKEGSLRGGTLSHSIAQGIHTLVDRSSLHSAAERQPLSREGSRHGPGSREGSVRLGRRGGAAAAVVVLQPGDVVEGDSAAASPEPAASNPCFPPLNVRGEGEEGAEQVEGEQEEDGDALFLRQLERLRVSSRRGGDDGDQPAAAAAAAAVASPSRPTPPLPPSPPPPSPPQRQLGAPRPVFYDFLVASGSSPAARWGHAAAPLGPDALVVVGGVGAAVFEDVHVFDAISGSWHEVRTTGPPMQRQQQAQQQQGLQRTPSNDGSSCGTPSSSNLSTPSSSSSPRPLNFAARAAPLTASSAASAALFARRDAGPGPSFGAAAAEWPSGSGRVFVFGGRQGRGFLRSAHELDVGRGAWRTLRADSVADPRTAAEAERRRLLGANAAAASPSAPSPARSIKAGGAGVGGGRGPPAVAGATLTAVGGHGLLLYGGAGKKVSGEVWLLRPRSLHSQSGEGNASGSGRSGARGGGGARHRNDTDDDDEEEETSSLYPRYSNDTWIKLDISPDPVEGAPRPRHGHAAFLGPCGRDTVVFFGGAASDGSALNDTWLLDLRSRAWKRPRHPAGSCPPPRARFSHCAALITTAAAEAGTGGSGGREGAALVFGGCTPEGLFLNDAHVLDLAHWSWSPAVAPAGPPPPPPRYGASATAVGGRLLLYGGSDARQPFGGVVSVVTDFGSDLNAVAGDLLVSGSYPRDAAPAGAQRRTSAAPAVPAAAAEAGAEALPSSPSLSLAPLSPSFATPVAAPPPQPSLPSSSPPPPATGGSMRSRLADALGRRSAQATAAAAARKAAVAEGLFRAERERAESLAAELAAARLLLGEERAALEGEARRAALDLSASARREAESAGRAAAAAESARREAELRAEEAERRAEEADRRADEAEEREQHSVSASDREALLVASLRARLVAAEAGRAAAAREAVAARAAADAARQGAARARAEAVSGATARSCASLALMEAEVSRLQAHARALEAALEGARKAALVAVGAAGGGGGGGGGDANASSSSSSSSSSKIAALELQLSRYRGEPASLASLSPEELRSLEDELVRSARAAAAAAREADAASAAALRAALADREARISSLTRSSLSSGGGGGSAVARAPPPPAAAAAASSTTECGICLEKEVEVSLDCGHLMCSGCAEKQRAQKGRCPFCDAVCSGPPRRIFV